MTKPTQDKETLREAVARAIAETEGFDPAMDHIEGWYETADAAIATMFERLRTPSEAMVEVTQADRNFAAYWIAQSVQSFSERSAYRKEIEAGQHDAHPMVITAATHRIEAAKAERDRLQQKIETLEAALRFYARENSWKSCGVYMSGQSQPSSAEVDRGNKARKALESQP